MEEKGFLHHAKGITTILWPNILRLSLENKKATEEALPPTEGENLPPLEEGIINNTYSMDNHTIPRIPKIHELSKGKYRYALGIKPKGSLHQEQITGKLTEAEYKYMVEALPEYEGLAV